jgi:nucleoid-associated protein YgaU
VVKKLAIVLSLVLTGVGMAHHFRKDASTVPSPSQTLEAPAFRQSVTRRLIPAPHDSSSPAEIPPPISEPFRIPLVETRGSLVDLAVQEQPEFRRELHPASAMFRPRDSEDEEAEPEVKDAALNGRRSIVRHELGDLNEAMQGPILAAAEHTIVDGDTLSAIAQKYLGRADRYLEIFEQNRDVLHSPDILPIGKVLKIPGSG